jgi:hypothetical protein
LRQRLLALPLEDRRFELLVVTHIDVDHIAGIVRLLEDPLPGLSIGELWFNGRRHLTSDRMLGVRDAVRMTEVLDLSERPWNLAFDGGAVVLPEDHVLPTVEFSGGLRLTLLGPRRQRLTDLAEHWDEELEEIGRKVKPASQPPSDMQDVMLGSRLPDIGSLASSAFDPDTSKPNGSSISLLAEYDGKRVLLAGDAYASDVLAAVKTLALAEGERRLPIDALKLSHHGGRKNTSADLLGALACKRFLFSSDGTIYRHPQPESVARVITSGRACGVPELWFNYRSEVSGLWDDGDLFDAPGRSYQPRYPEGTPGILVEL